MSMMKVLEKRLGVGISSGSLGAAFLQDPKLIALSVAAALNMVILIPPVSLSFCSALVVRLCANLA